MNQPSRSRGGVVTWLIVLGLAMGPAISNGFARFAYGLLLPAMRDDLGWTYTQAGWINTANAIGYLAGALLALFYIRQLGAVRMFVGGMMLTTAALILSGLTREFWPLTAWRILAGIGGAPVFIAGGALASALFRDNGSRNALAIAVYFGGGGLGMLLTGQLIPPLIDRLGVTAWPQVWVFLGLCSALTLVPALWAAWALRAPAGPTQAQAGGGLVVRPMLPALTGYFLFGLGYIVYMTFLVAWMRAEGARVELVVITWSILSLGVMLSPFVWRPVLARSAGGGAMSLANMFTGVGTLSALLVSGSTGILLSATLFGLAFFMVPTAVTNFSKKNFPEAQWGAAVALFTTLFAIGQIIGPVAAGYLSDQTSSVTPGLVAAGIVLLLGAGIGVFQKPLGLQAAGKQLAHSAGTASA